jgi:hypothetical protein
MRHSLSSAGEGTRPSFMDFEVANDFVGGVCRPHGG